MKIKTGIKAGADQTRNQTRDQLKDQFKGGEQREAVIIVGACEGLYPGQGQQGQARPSLCTLTQRACRLQASR